MHVSLPFWEQTFLALTRPVCALKNARDYFGSRPLCHGLGSVRAFCREKFSFSTLQDGPARSDETANTLEDFFASSRCHRHGNVSTKTGPPQRLERARVALLSHSYSCTVVAWFLANLGTFGFASPFCVKRLPQVSLTI